MPNSAHSIFIWQPGDKAYAVIVDSTELSDVDIFDITNPRQPQFVADIDLFELALFQEHDIFDDPGFAIGGQPFLHDMVVKVIDDAPIMLASYWDVGYIKVDIADPTNPRDHRRLRVRDDDPLMKIPTTDEGWLARGQRAPGEFSHDNHYVLAADEDFAQFRFIGRVSPGEPEESRFFVAGQPDEGPLVTPDTPLEGDTRFIGLGCDPATIASATADVKIAVAERGSCNFQVKVQNAEAQGYTAVIIFTPRTALRRATSC